MKKDRVIFRTRRLKAVPASQVDVPDLVAMFNHPRMQPHVCYVQYDEARMTQFLHDSDQTKGPVSQQTLVLMEKDTGLVRENLIGYARIKHDTRQVYPVIGLAIKPDAQNQGFGQEALKGLTVAAFNTCGGAYVTAAIDSDNEISAHVLRQAGFSRIEKKERDYFNGRVWKDTLIYRICRDQVGLGYSFAARYL